MLTRVEHEKSFIALGPGFNHAKQRYERVSQTIF